MEITKAHKSIFFNSGFHLPKLIAKSSHVIDVGEDFLYSDRSGLVGLDISNHELNNKSDAEFFDAMQRLFCYTTTGRRKEITNDMIAKFRNKAGGEYRNTALNEEVSWNRILS